MKAHNIDKVATMIAVIFAVVVGAAWTALYWLLWPASDPTRPIASYSADATGASRDVFRAGETVYIYREFEVLRVGPRLVKWTLVNEDLSIVVLFYDAAAPPGDELGIHKRAFQVPVPASAPPGRYVLKATSSYWLNPLRPLIEYPLPPVHFRVVK